MSNPSLSQWQALVPFLGDVLGNTAEVILETPEDGIIAVANGALLDHRAGDPMTMQTASLLEQGLDRDLTFHSCAGHNPSTGKPLRRWHYFIRKEDEAAPSAVLSVPKKLPMHRKIYGTKNMSMK